jgi:signal transduction histidine kinase
LRRSAVWVTRSRISFGAAGAEWTRRFSSLRWRIATFYALLLVGVIAIVAVVLTVQLRSILLDAARTRVDSIGEDIVQQLVRSAPTGPFTDNGTIQQELTSPGNLDHWASPTTYVEVDTLDGYPYGKSTNMGIAVLGRSPLPRPGPVLYSIETVPSLGKLLVRDELLSYPGVAIVIKVGESLGVYDVTIARARTLLTIVAILAAILVATGSYALASSAIRPIEQLIAAMREIRSDQLDKRLGWLGRTDELGQLAQSFDAMLERIEGGFARERQFISDASHELKTPLTIINANAQMLERWADRNPDIRSESLRAIRDESAALARMINGMLLLAKAESGDGIPREPVGLDSVVGEAVRSGRPRAEEKALALNFVSSAPAGGPIVFGDPNLLRQLFSNLIDNAIKFTDRGHVDVRLSASNGKATVDVVDTGVGIDSEALERVFDRFYRTDKSRDRAVPGTGLGLAIVRSIANVHDGTVVATRAAEGGAAFRVTLPTLTALS